MEGKRKARKKDDIIANKKATWKVKTEKKRREGIGGGKRREVGKRDKRG